MNKNTLIKDIVETNIITFSPEDNLAKVWEIFTLNNISGAPVVNLEGNVEGVISQTDIIDELFLESPNLASMCGYYKDTLEWAIEGHSSLKDFKGTLVSELMTEAAFMAYPEDTAGKTAKTMIENRIHRVLVVDDGKLMGIVTSFDLLQCLT